MISSIRGKISTINSSSGSNGSPKFSLNVLFNGVIVSAFAEVMLAMGVRLMLHSSLWRFVVDSISFRRGLGCRSGDLIFAWNLKEISPKFLCLYLLGWSFIEQYHSVHIKSDFTSYLSHLIISHWHFYQFVKYVFFLFCHFLCILLDALALALKKTTLWKIPDDQRLNERIFAGTLSQMSDKKKKKGTLFQVKSNRYGFFRRPEESFRDIIYDGFLTFTLKGLFRDGLPQVKWRQVR